MYYRLTTATSKGEWYYNFNPKFDLVATIYKISTLRGCIATLDEELLTYTKAVKGLYTK